jgi:hypothetical protein
VDVVGLKDAADVGLVRLALAQALNRRFLVPECFQEQIGELLGVERLLGERGYGLFNLDRVHRFPQPRPWSLGGKVRP